MSPVAPPSAGRTMWLMARMRMTRLLNQSSANLFRKFRKKRSGSAKRSNMWVLSLLVALMMSFSFLTLARTSVLNLQCKLVPSSACLWVDKRGEHRIDYNTAADEVHQAPFEVQLRTGLTLQLSLLFVVSFMLPLASRELSQPDWDLEWLVTLPVERSTLLWGRLVERSASNFTGLLALMPPCAMIAWYSGYRWGLPLVVLASLALLLPLAALLHTLADTGLRMTLPASQLRNLQAFSSLIGMPFMYFAMALGLPTASGFVMEWARAFPAWTAWTPPGLLIQAIQARTLAEAGPHVALLLAQAVLLLWGGVRLMAYQLRGGVVGASSRPGARRRDAALAGATASTVTASAASASASASAGPAWRRWLETHLLSTIKRRELRLLARDRNFLVQTLLLPVVIVGSQVVINGKLSSLAQLGANPTLVATTAFGIGVYVLMLSAFQTLNNEGHALWLLYTFPRSVESLLKEKAQLWGVLALMYPLAVFGAGAAYAPALDWQWALLLVIVAAGIPIYSVIAVALGVFACDPQAVEARSKVRPTYAYLYLLLSSFYAYSVYTSVWSQKLVIMVLSGALALALWQKARDQLPYLLDPAASPPARVSASDGLIAATLFFVLQALVMVLMALGRKGAAPSLQTLTQAFAIAGVVVYLLARLVYWRGKTQGVPAIWRRGSPPGALRRSVALGLGLGALASVPALVYLAVMRHTPLWEDLARQGLPVEAHGAHIGWLFALAVVAAPLCEEFIFRGLIFGGLLRSMKPASAMLASAAIFAIIHPPLSMLPVFILGLCAAYAYHRCKTLLAPMLAHALYNAVVLGWQLSGSMG